MGSLAQRIHGKAPEIMGSRLKAQLEVLQQSTAERGTAQEHASKQILSISLAHECSLCFCPTNVAYDQLMHDVGRQHPALRGLSRKQTLHSYSNSCARGAISRARRC